MRRRNEATERSRTSSARSAVTSVRRPRCFSAPARGAGRGAAAGRPAPRRAVRGASSSSASSAGRAAGAAGALGFFLAEALLGDFVGLALGFFLVLAAFFFLVLARFGGLALGLVADLARRAPARLFLGDLALFGLAHAAVGERVGARGALFLGQRAQHDAGRLRRFGGAGAGAAVPAFCAAARFLGASAGAGSALASARRADRCGA